jgi:hypothetical protein
VRPYLQIPKATRSNRNPRKLKVWSMDSCDRFVFASGKVSGTSSERGLV